MKIHIQTMVNLIQSFVAIQFISFIMQNNQRLPVDSTMLIECFRHLYSPQSDSSTRKRADQCLLDLEKYPAPLLHSLLQLFQSTSDPLLAFQALVYFANVVKRNWTVRRRQNEECEFEALKKVIRNQLISMVGTSNKTTLPTLFDVIKFIVKVDYPHHYPAFTSLSLQILAQAEQQGQAISDMFVTMMKQLREIFVEFSERKKTMAKKLFQQNLRLLINGAGAVSVSFRGFIQSNQQLSSNIVKISKYADQIILYVLRSAPTDIQDEQQTSNVMSFLQEKLESLVSLHRSTSQREVRVLLEKNIKSLIFDFGLLEQAKPLLMSCILPRLYQVLFYVITHHADFVKNGPLKYSLIGLRRIFKEFVYYSDDNLFNSSIRGKHSSAHTMTLRQNCHRFYQQNITQTVVTNLLQFLISSPFAREKTAQSSFDYDQSGLLDKGQEKQLTLEGCIVWLMHAMLERFPELTISLIHNLITNCLQSDWKNLNEGTICNLLSLVAILPSACKKQAATLQKFPLLQTLQFIYKTPRLQAKFPAIVAGWLDAFQQGQLGGLIDVLLNFMEGAASRAEEEEVVDVLLSCCQCLNKIVVQKGQSIDLGRVVEKSVPLCLILLGKLDNPEVLWPMVNLISSLISRVQVRGDLLLKSLEGAHLSILVQNQNQLLVEALCEMLKGFLCVLPRRVPAGGVHELVCGFLNCHLSRVEAINHQKIFYLWYVAIREYSHIHCCDNFYTELFYNHFRKNLFRKTPTLLYILQQYLLSGLIPSQLQQLVQIILDCYSEADLLQQEEQDKLKVAALSFMITLIATHRLEEVNSDQMLHLILRDFCRQEGVSATVRNSLLSIINRYIIRFQGPFFSYLQSRQLPQPVFLQAYVNNMRSLTSHTAIKINSIALLSFLNSVDPGLILPHFPFLMTITLPAIEFARSTQQQGLPQVIIDHSPSLRFASNVLSDRKDQIRKKDSFDSFDLPALFSKEMRTFIGRTGMGSAMDITTIIGQQSANKLLSLL